MDIGNGKETVGFLMILKVLILQTQYVEQLLLELNYKKQLIGDGQFVN